MLHWLMLAYLSQRFQEDVACKQLADDPIPTSAPSHPDRLSDTAASADENSCALCCRFCASKPVWETEKTFSFLGCGKSIKSLIDVNENEVN